MIEGSPIQPESENTTKNIVVVDTLQASYNFWCPLNGIKWVPKQTVGEPGTESTVKHIFYTFYNVEQNEVVKSRGEQNQVPHRELLFSDARRHERSVREKPELKKHKFQKHKNNHKSRMYKRSVREKARV